MKTDKMNKNPINQARRMRVFFGPFKGAPVYLNIKNAKRKILGVYEHVLNPWIAEKAPLSEFIMDVGANNGYDTYGLAYLASHKNTRNIHVFAIEPALDRFPELSVPKNWSDYSKCNVELIKKFAGKSISEQNITLDALYTQNSDVLGKAGLIKIDVEGFECEVLEGSFSLLNCKDVNWLIEIHGKAMIPKVARFFCQMQRSFLIKNLTEHPLFGKECREIETFWLLTI